MNSVVNNQQSFESQVVVSRHIDADSTPLAFFETLDGYVAVRWSTDKVLLQYVCTAEPGDPYRWVVQTDAPLRQSLANVLDIDCAPKLITLDCILFHEAPVGSHSPDSNQNLLDCMWSDLQRDKITVTANLAFDNSEHDIQVTFNNILNRQRLYKRLQAFERLRASYSA